MKKIPRPRLRKKKSAEPAEAPNRITNETVAEHRERVLAGGRRFKYPMQYAKHRLVINTIIISIVALIIVAAVVWWQLYPAQNTSAFFYRITRVLPLPVAVVDGQAVRYSDYLMWFRSQEHNLQYKQGVNLYAKENKTQLDLFKRQSIDDTIAGTYAAKLAAQLRLKVTSQEVSDDLKLQRKSNDGYMSEETYYAVILDHFGWTPDEVNEVTTRKLLRQKVAYQVDTTAMSLKNELSTALRAGTDFDKIAAAIQPRNGVKVESSITPFVPNNNQDGGLAEKASQLTVGQVSEVFRSTNGDGYYVVKPLQKDNNGRVSYASLKVPLTMFEKQLAKLKSERKITEYITVPRVNISASNQ